MVMSGCPAVAGAGGAAGAAGGAAGAGRCGARGWGGRVGGAAAGDERIVGAGYTWSVRLSLVGASSSSEQDGLSQAKAILKVW